MTDQPIAPSIFDSFNARALRPALVAKTFVPSAHYATLLKRRHTLIVGPRGSGKTTLLKMLQQGALEVWSHPQAEDYVRQIDYTGIFVASDISWGAQLGALGRGKLTDTDTRQVLGIAAFTTHVLRALVSAMIGRSAKSSDGTIRTIRRVSLSSTAEAALANDIAHAWKLSIDVSSLLSIKHALGDRLLWIREVANKEALLGENGRQERLASEAALHLHFLQAASVAIDRFDDHVGEGESRWAFLFDELEVAPSWVREELLRSLRGADERFLFKLALAPYSRDLDPLMSPIGGAVGEDYDTIKLWYPEKVDVYNFAEELWYGMLRERNIPLLSPRKVLGRSYFESPRETYGKSATAYRPDSKIGRTFKSLADADQSFREYLAKKGIDLSQLQLVTPMQRAADLRKIGPVVAVREFFRVHDRAREGHRDRRARSRKALSLYVGAESMFAATEGNPRWFIGLMGAVLSRWPEKRGVVKKTVQAEELEKATDRFSALLRTTPLLPDTNPHTQRGLLPLLNEIGQYFFRAVVEDEFAAEPPGTFIVTPNTPPTLLTALGVALNAGAIVNVPIQQEKGERPIMASLVGRRFRLSYLLAPVYGLPVRIGKPISLTTILQRVESESERQLFLE